MKRLHCFKSILLMVLVVCLSFGGVTNSISSPVVYAKASKIKINKKSATLIVGNSLKLKISGTKKKIKWKTSDKKVASVNQSGKVTAKKAGKATITATVSGKKYTCKITVNAVLSATELTLSPYDTIKLKLIGAPVKRFSSSDPSVASVLGNGFIAAYRIGTTTITCVDKNRKIYRCYVTVRYSEKQLYNQYVIELSNLDRAYSNTVADIDKYYIDYTQKVQNDITYYNGQIASLWLSIKPFTDPYYAKVAECEKRLEEINREEMAAGGLGGDIYAAKRAYCYNEMMDYKSAIKTMEGSISDKVIQYQNQIDNCPTELEIAEARKLALAKAKSDYDSAVEALKIKYNQK